MGRGKLYSIPVIGIFALAGVVVTWSRTSSTIYPYSIEQPSSFRHEVVRDGALNVAGDFYWPTPPGSSITNLNVKAVPGSRVKDGSASLRSQSGRNVHRISWMHLAGQREPLIRADFKGIPGRWTIEQVTFVARGLVWYVTASYDVKYRKFRPMLLRMMKSFRLK